MEIEKRYYGELNLMDFLRDAQYRGEIDVWYECESLQFYPNPINMTIECYEATEGDEKEFEVYFDRENPFYSDIRVENGSPIIKTDDNLYPIIKAMNVYKGFIDEGYDGDLKILQEDMNNLRCDGFRIKVDMDYLDGEYSIREVQIIKDLKA